MKYTLEATKPSSIEFSLTITMTLKEWAHLEQQLDTRWPSAEIGQAITDMTIQAQQSFYPKNPSTETT